MLFRSASTHELGLELSGDKSLKHFSLEKAHTQAHTHRHTHTCIHTQANTALTFEPGARVFPEQRALVDEPSPEQFASSEQLPVSNLGFGSWV